MPYMQYNDKLGNGLADPGLLFQVPTFQSSNEPVVSSGRVRMEKQSVVNDNTFISARYNGV